MTTYPPQPASVKDDEASLQPVDTATPPLATNTAGESVQSPEAPVSPAETIVPSLAAPERPTITQTPSSSAMDFAAQTSIIYSPVPDSQEPSQPVGNDGGADVLSSRAGNTVAQGKDEKPQMTSTAVQTGEKEITMGGGEEATKLVAIEGGLAEEGGDAVVEAKQETGA